MGTGDWQPENIFLKFRYPILILLAGLILISFGAFIFKSGIFSSPTKIEVLESTQAGQGKEITVEIGGSVVSPGVFKLPGDSRVEDLIIKSGGFSANADRDWTNKYLNRAAKLTDGQKVYVPSIDWQSNPSGANKSGDIKVDQPVLGLTGTDLVNINTASLNELDTLPGIGQVYGQNIIEHRPYSDIAELVSKGAIKQSLFDKIKNLISVY